MNLPRQISATALVVAGMALVALAPASAQSATKNKPDTVAASSGGMAKASNTMGRTHAATISHQSTTAFAQGVTNSTVTEAPKVASELK